jgi:hypothetical protein
MPGIIKNQKTTARIRNPATGRCKKSQPPPRPVPRPAQSKLKGRNEYLEQKRKELEEKIQQLEDSEGEEIKELRGNNEELEGRIEELEEVGEENEELKEKLEQYKAFYELLTIVGRELCPLWTEDFSWKISNKWPTRHRPQYKKVKVLLVRWASGDLGVSQEIDMLDHISTHCYRYNVSKYCIPDFQPTSVLNKRVWEFVGDNASDTLLIFYYGGHCRIDPLRNETYWGA